MSLYVCQYCGYPINGYDGKPKVPCPNCRYNHGRPGTRRWVPYDEAFPSRDEAPTTTVGTPANPNKSVQVCNNPFKRGHSLAHGQKLESWSDYHRANREMGLVDVGHEAKESDWKAHQAGKEARENHGPSGAFYKE